MWKFCSLSMILFFYIFFLIIMDAFAPGWVIFDIRQGIFVCNVCRQRNIFSSSCLWQIEDLSDCSQFIQSWCESTSWRKSEIDQGTLACSCSIKTLDCNKKMPAAHNWETKEGRSPKQSKWHCDKELLGRRQHWRQHIHYQSPFMCHVHNQVSIPNFAVLEQEM